MLKNLAKSLALFSTLIMLNACNGGGGGGIFVAPSPSPTTTSTPTPIVKESGILYMNMSSVSLPQEQQTSLQLILSGSKNITNLPVQLLSLNPAVATVSPSVCYVSTESNVCNLTVSALESGITAIGAVATGYSSSPTTTVIVSNKQTSSGLSFNLSSINLSAGESALLVLTLNNPLQVAPKVVTLSSSPTGFIDVTPASCSLSTSNPACNVTVTGKQITGSTMVTAAADGYITATANINVTLPLVGWMATNAAPTSVAGRANNIGFTSSQDGNLYLSYQGSDRFVLYQYLFNQQTYAWTQIASTLNMSVGSYTSSILVDRQNNIYLSYLDHPTTDSPSLVAYFSAEPDKIDFNTASKVEHAYPYTFHPSGTELGTCDPASRTESDTAAEVTAALTDGDSQIMAYSDTTSVAPSAFNVYDNNGNLIGYCDNPGYTGGNKLTIFGGGFDSRSISPGLVNLVQIKSTPPTNNYPIYVAYKDAYYSGGVTVQVVDSAVGSWTTLGTPGFTGKSINHLSLAVDSTGVPYVAFEHQNQRLAVRKWNGSAWVSVGADYISSDIATWVSITVNPLTNIPYVAYQEGAKIHVKKFDGTNWVDVGSDLANINNNYGAYTNLIMRQVSIDDYEPAIAYQASAPNVTTSSLSVYYYVPPTTLAGLITKYKDWQPSK